jgi:hypothetical protein
VALIFFWEVMVTLLIFFIYRICSTTNQLIPSQPLETSTTERKCIPYRCIFSLFLFLYLFSLSHFLSFLFFLYLIPSSSSSFFFYLFSSSSSSSFLSYCSQCQFRW